MANHKSAKKRAKQTKVKTAVNARIKSSVRTFEKKFLSMISDGKLDEAKDLFKTVSSKVDRAAKSGVMHKNTAARKISRLALRLTKAS